MCLIMKLLSVVRTDTLLFYLLYAERYTDIRITYLYLVYFNLSLIVSHLVYLYEIEKSLRS